MGLVIELVFGLICVARTLPLAIWALLVESLGGKAGEGASAGAKAGAFDVICISHVPWHHAWQRNHHVMSGLARHGTVLYCHPVKLFGFRAHWTRVMRPVRRSESGVWVHYPVIIPGVRSSSFIKRLNQVLLGASLRRLMKRLAMRSPVLWYYFPDMVFMIGRLGERAIVYDIQDNYEHFFWSSSDLPQRERELLAAADQVFTGTYTLYDKNRAFARVAEFIPCGVDFEFFNQVRRKPLSWPEGFRGFYEKLRPPILGYFGLIDDRIDLALIAELARRRPEWQFLLIGPYDLVKEKFKPMPNVHFTDQVEYADLPRHAQAFDVCLMPFLMNELTRAINPTKTLEYFALERPVVSSPIPDMMRFYGEAIDFATDADGWEKAIEKSLQPDPIRLAKALEIARGRSWQAVIERFRSRTQEAIDARLLNAQTR